MARWSNILSCSLCVQHSVMPLLFIPVSSFHEISYGNLLGQSSTPLSKVGSSNLGSFTKDTRLGQEK